MSVAGQPKEAAPAIAGIEAGIEAGTDPVCRASTGAGGAASTAGAANADDALAAAKGSSTFPATNTQVAQTVASATAAGASVAGDGSHGAATAMAAADRAMPISRAAWARRVLSTLPAPRAAAARSARPHNWLMVR